MIAEIKQLVEMGFSLTDAKELVMADKGSNAPNASPDISLQRDNIASAPVTSSQESNSVVKSANVLVKKVFLSTEERIPKLETFDVEIILQKEKIMSMKKGVVRGEVDTLNDVFTLLEHPSKKTLNSTSDVIKKESLYEAHLRAGLIKTITVIIPESGKAENVFKSASNLVGEISTYSNIQFSRKF